jgi:hypothetical protein
MKFSTQTSPYMVRIINETLIALVNSLTNGVNQWDKLEEMARKGGKEKWMRREAFPLPPKILLYACLSLKMQKFAKLNMVNCINLESVRIYIHLQKCQYHEWLFLQVGQHFEWNDNLSLSRSKMWWRVTVHVIVGQRMYHYKTIATILIISVINQHYCLSISMIDPS